MSFIFPCGKQQCNPGMVLISSFSFLFFLSYDSKNSRDDSDSRQDDQMVSKRRLWPVLNIVPLSIPCHTQLIAF